jgi:hypothetical protein
MIKNDKDVWVTTEINDLWLFDKLILSRKLGYICGPAGIPVPNPGNYIVRPITNLEGMGIGASICHIQNTTDHLPAGYFWCEIFEGRHISVDYNYGKPILSVEGFRNQDDPLYRFSKWLKVDQLYHIPLEVSVLRKFEYSNIEFIGNKIIEVHLRGNPDFIYNNSIAIPVWEDTVIEETENFRFVSSPDYKRKGFLIDIINERL